ncbi:hypothetical protein K439DRAFT_1638995 [Ramaria rubella]|nr:hypothetical protein K439DRAFT_1640861 [Ramaria rubella]KAF8578259.1 hypothetical protein K439DRAFT_1638995 [Ramaria rubella]
MHKVAAICSSNSMCCRRSHSRARDGMIFAKYSWISRFETSAVPGPGVATFLDCTLLALAPAQI